MQWPTRQGIITHKHEPTLALEYQDVKVYGAAKSDIKKPGAYSLVFNVSGYSLLWAAKNMVHGPRPWQELNKYLRQQTCEEVVVNWGDGEALDTGKPFWLGFWEIVKKQKVKSIVVCCMGGHGRTGTALAALRVVLLGEKAEVAIQKVRDTICWECVETIAQEKYIYMLAGEEFPEKKAIQFSKNPNEEAQVEFRFCAVCHGLSAKTMNMGSNVYCIACVKKEMSSCEVTGDDRVKAIRDALANKAASGEANAHARSVATRADSVKASGTNKGGQQGKKATCDYCGKFLRHGGTKGTFGFTLCHDCNKEEETDLIAQEAEKQSREQGGTVKCDICSGETKVLFGLVLQDGEDVMACKVCKDAYDVLVETDGDIGTAGC